MIGSFSKSQQLVSFVALLLVAVPAAMGQQSDGLSSRRDNQALDEIIVVTESEAPVGVTSDDLADYFGGAATIVRPPASTLDATNQVKPNILEIQNSTSISSGLVPVNDQPAFRSAPNINFDQTQDLESLSASASASSLASTTTSQRRNAETSRERPLSTDQLAGSTANQDLVTNDPFESMESRLDRKGSVTFRRTPLSEVIFMISDLWKINIVVGQQVEGEVSGAFNSAPLREVLDAVLSSSNYGYRVTGNSLVVVPRDSLGSDDATFRTEILTLPPDLRDEASLETIKVLLSSRGQFRPLGTDRVLIMDTPTRIDRVRQVIGNVNPQGSSTLPSQPGSSTDIQGQQTGDSAFPGSGYVGSSIAYFSPQFTDAQAMAEPLQTALGEEIIVAVYADENRIMIRGTPAQIQLASEAIEQLDRPREQVRITAMIYDVSLNEVERLGINWNLQPHSAGTIATDLNDAESLVFRNLLSASTNLITDTAATGAGNFGITTFNNNFNVDMLLQALHGNTEAKLLADPNVTVGDRREASIRIVRKIPIIAAEPVDQSGVVFSQVQFEEAGIILNVQPRISRDGTIDLTVQPEYSVVSDFINNNPVIDTRNATTTVRVANGQTFVLGGLRQKTLNKTIRGVPWLKDIKHIGRLFRANDTQIVESELIVFIRTDLISPADCLNQRTSIALDVASTELDEIPHAQLAPMTPQYDDQCCPSNVGRYRPNPGASSTYVVPIELESPILHGPAVELIE
ncbi:MAG: secretin N-terminal domain-containing protein [Planctomycetota bacterium]